ncbi:MAG: hypothetical protein WCO98_02100 [bacterium]
MKKQLETDGSIFNIKQILNNEAACREFIIHKCEELKIIRCPDCKSTNIHNVAGKLGFFDCYSKKHSKYERFSVFNYIRCFKRIKRLSKLLSVLYLFIEKEGIGNSDLTDLGITKKNKIPINWQHQIYFFLQSINFPILTGIGEVFLVDGPKNKILMISTSYHNANDKKVTRFEKITLLDTIHDINEELQNIGINNCLEYNIFCQQSQVVQELKKLEKYDNIKILTKEDLCDLKLFFKKFNEWKDITAKEVPKLNEDIKEELRKNDVFFDEYNELLNRKYEKNKRAVKDLIDYLLTNNFINKNNANKLNKEFIIQKIKNEESLKSFFNKCAVNTNQPDLINKKMNREINKLNSEYKRIVKNIKCTLNADSIVEKFEEYNKKIKIIINKKGDVKKEVSTDKPWRSNLSFACAEYNFRKFFERQRASEIEVFERLIEIIIISHNDFPKNTEDKTPSSP